MCSAITKSLPPWRLFLAATVLGCLTTFPQGWNATIINIPEQQFLDFFNSSFRSHYGYYLSQSSLESLWAFALNISSVSAIVAALLCMKMIPYTGLKNGMSFWGGLGTFIGTTLLAAVKLADSFELFIVGQAIIGISIAYSNNLLFIMLPEASPNYARGFVAVWVNVLWIVNQVLGTVASLPQAFGVQDRFWLLLGLPLFPVVIQFAIYQFFPDSPKRIYIHIKDREAASKSVRFYHGDDADIAAVFKEYDEEALLEEETMSIMEVLTSPALRFPLLITLMVTFGAYWGGTGPAATYSTHMFENAGASGQIADIGSLVVVLVCVPAAFVAMFLIDRLGRRILLISGFVSACICLIGMIIFPLFPARWAQIMEIICVVLLIFVMNWGPLTICSFLAAEILPFQARAVGFGVNGVMTNICLIGSSQLYGGLNEKIGSLLFILFLVPLVVVTGVLYFKMPETMNSSAKDVSEMMHNERHNSFD